MLLVAANLHKSFWYEGCACLKRLAAAGIVECSRRGAERWLHALVCGVRVGTAYTSYPGRGDADRVGHTFGMGSPPGSKQTNGAESVG